MKLPGQSEATQQRKDYEMQMKIELSWRLKATLATGVAAMSLLVSLSTAMAETVRLDPKDDSIAVGIDDLEVNGTFYNVAFVNEGPDEIYGPSPFAFDFASEADANAAVDAVIAALNASSATRTSSEGVSNPPRIVNYFLVGWDEDEVRGRTSFLQGFYDKDTWINSLAGNDGSQPSFASDQYADFSVVGSTCEGDLEQAESDLDECRESLDEASDLDADGVAGLDDLCPRTPPDAAVSDVGCSRSEFCEAIDTNTAAGLRRCISATWNERGSSIVNIFGTCRARYVGWNRLCRAIRP